MSADVSGTRVVARDLFWLWLASVAAALAVGVIAPVYWDSFSYVRQSIDGDVGGLAFGRPLFLLISHAIAHAGLALGGSALRVDGWLRAWWLLIAATSAPATCLLAERAGLSSRAARIAGFAMAASPALAHTNSAMLTDGPSLAVATWALVAGADAMTRGSLARAALAGVLAGAAFGLREQAVISLAGLVLMLAAAAPSRRVKLAATIGCAAFVVAAAPVVYVGITQPGYWQSISGWVTAMRTERSTHAFGVRDAAFYALWLVLLGPAMLAAAAFAWIRRTRAVTTRGILAAVTVPALLELIALAFYPDIAYSPRYLVVALPGALAIPAAIVIDPRLTSASRVRWLAAAGLAPLLIAAPFALRYNARQQDALADLARDVAALPDRSVVVTGWMCPEIPLLRSEARAGFGVDPGWDAICPGWRWPASLPEALNAARGDGRLVVIDLRPSSWVGEEQRRTRDEAAQYADRTTQGDSVRIWR